MDSPLLPAALATTASARFDCHLHLSEYWPNPKENVHRPGLPLDIPTLLAELDAHRISDGLLLQLEDAPDVEATLREASALARASGGRLWPTSTVDPTRGESEVARALELWEGSRNLCAIKLYPGYRAFYPHDPRLAPVYEFAARRRIPVMFHQGDTLDPLGLVKYARPVEVDEVAVRYREVKFVLCHLGNPWIEETAEMVYKNPNVYTDTSGLVWSPARPYYAAMIRRAQRRLDNAIAAIGDCTQVLYGSDWPLESIATAVSIVEGLTIPPEDREKILGANARALFTRPSGAD
jgi:predicted TIM-barrel fold metal-dependent hydrolase